MQWTPGPNAGFTSGTPWLPLADDYGRHNVEVEQEEPGSMLALHHRLIELRRSEPALSLGRYAPVPIGGDLLLYTRVPEGEGRRFLIALNLGHDPQVINLPDAEHSGKIVISTHLDRADEPVDGTLQLRADEGLVIALE